MTFAELVDGWVFCGQRLLRLRYERARAAALTDADQEVLRKIFDLYVTRLTDHRRDLEMLQNDTSKVDIVLQRATSKDYYMSGLLGDRFQIAESITPVGTYYIVDHKMPDLLYRPGGPDKDFPRYDSLEAAQTKVDYLLDIVGKQTTTRSKGALRMAAEKKEAAAAKAKRERGPSAASRFRELIMAGKMTDDEIFATVQKEHGLSDDKRSYVTWYRKALAKDGQNPPAPKGGEAAKIKAEKAKVLQVAATAQKKALSKATPSATAATDRLVAAAKKEARGRKPGRSKAA